MSKFTFVVLCVVVASLSKVNAGEDLHAAFHEAIKPIMEECSKEHGVSADEIQSAQKTGTAEGIKPCFLGCVFKKAGILNSKGDYDADTALTKVRKVVKDDEQYAKLAEIGKQCTSVNDKAVSDGEAGCEKAALLAACFLEHKGKIPI